MTAAAQRKLQKDIEVALKKVDDGIDEFDHVWEQATTASNNSQKEKLGEELKKSINKLQRLRVQIREWIGQTDIKNNSKEKLEDARKRIENDMQRFKEFERDLKTKAFSSCALAKADELELEEAEKMKYQEWLVATIQTLSEQLEEYEADLEILGNKKSLSSDEKHRQSQLKDSQERHQWHVKKLEQILRALDNDALDVTDLAIVKESVELYCENHNDPDYPHDEALYDCFDLTAYEDHAAKPRTPSMDIKEGGTPKEEPQKKSKEKEKRKKDEKKEKKKEDKKATSTPGGASNKSGSNSGRADAKATPPEPRGDGKVEGAPEEEDIKVQSDQLLLGGEAEEFVCKICQTHVVGCGPKLTNCSHLFCGDCLGQWFAAHPDSQTWAQRAKAAGPERVVPCPVCKQPLNEKRDLYPVCGATSRSENLLLWRMLSSLKIMCINHSRMRSDGRCDWIGEYGQYQKHIARCGQNVDGAGSPSAPAATASASLPAAVSAVSADTRRSDSDSVVGTPVAAEKPVATGAHSGADRSPHSAPQQSPSQASAQAKAAVSPVAKPPAGKPYAEMSPKMSPASATAAPQASTAPRGPPVKDRAAEEREREAARKRERELAETARAEALRVEAEQRAEAARQQQQRAEAEAARAEALRVEAEQRAEAARQQQRAEAARMQAAAAAAAVAEAQLASASHGQGAQEAKSPSGAGQFLHPMADEPQQQSHSHAQAQAHAHAAAQVATQPSPAATQHSQSQAPAQARTSTPTQEADGSFMTQATSAFEPTGPNMVTCHIGDTIHVLERHASGWTYCKNLSLNSGNNVGWAPSWIVQPVPAEPEAAGAAQRAKVQETAPQPQAAPLQPANSGYAGLNNAHSQPTTALATGLQKVEQLHRSSQHAVATAPTPQHNMQAQAQQLRSAPVVEAAPLAPKAPSTVVRVATAAFSGTSSSQLTVSAGDLVEIVEAHASGWTYGRKVPSAAHPSLDPMGPVEGWFPDWVCAQK